MGLKVYTTHAGSALTEGEASLLAAAVRDHGRATLLVPGFAERDLCRRALADAGVGTGVDVATPASWIEGLWELFGDGRRVVAPLERRMLVAAMMAERDEGSIAPLRCNPGTVRLVSDIVESLLPAIVAPEEAGTDAAEPSNDAERIVFSLVGEYAGMLAERGLVEASEAACAMARLVESDAPACAGFVAVRDVARLPGHVMRLLAAVARSGEAAILLNPDQRPLAAELGAAGAVEMDAAARAGSARTADLGFLEVAGPHARAAAYADAIAGLVADGRDVVVAAARPAEVFDEVSPRLAARGICSECAVVARFGDTAVGRQFTALSDLVSRMRDAGDDPERAATWWPAPELTDWLYSPLSGMDSNSARKFDKKVRSDRSITPEAVLRTLQSYQSQTTTMRQRAERPNPYAEVPAVCAAVVSYLWQGRPVSALKAMCATATALPATAFGWRDGSVRAGIEATMAAKAIEALVDTARELDVPQSVAVTVLDCLAVSARRRAESTDFAHTEAVCDDDMPCVRFMTVADAALLPAGSVDAVFIADADIDSFPLSREDGVLSTLAAGLGFAGVELEPAARLRDLFHRALAAAASRALVARVTHDRQAKDRYPAAMWTELQASVRAFGGTVETASVGEGDIVGDLDAAGGSRLSRERVACLPPQELGDGAVRHLVLYRRDPDDPDRLVPRQLSASQIEGYVTCPLCWFMSSRVRPQSLDAGFGNMEKGNFVHDVMYRLHSDLAEEGVPRVTRENLAACLAKLSDVFDEVRAEHARNKTSSSGALVAHSALERIQVDEILPQLEAVVRYEAEALAPFAPEYLEYSFNGLGVEYAGRPLGGRIDRVDVDAEGRAMVIDYKHRTDVNAFKLADPTVAKRDGSVPADDPDWLPEHTQSLIYAQALRHSELELDARGALYFATKGGKPAMRGAVSEEFAEEERGDGRVPGLRTGFPDAAHGGSMGFDELLDRVEQTISRKLDSLEAGDVGAAEKPGARCAFNHDLGFERRNA